MTSPHALILQIGDRIGTALRATHDTVRPARLDHIGLAVFKVAVEEYCLLKSLGRVHELKYAPIRGVCQVYYCHFKARACQWKCWRRAFVIRSASISRSAPWLGRGLARSGIDSHSSA